jgi:addiction module RelE/StbE family toxin
MPNNKHKIIWSTHAKQDLIALYNYISLDSLTTAKKIINKIKQATFKLKKFPNIGHSILKETNPTINYQEIIIKSWRIIYFLENDQINIVAVIDSRRNLKDIFREKLLK